MIDGMAWLLDIERMWAKAQRHAFREQVQPFPTGRLGSLKDGGLSGRDA